MSRYFEQEVYGKRFSGVNPVTLDWSWIHTKMQVIFYRFSHAHFRFRGCECISDRSISKWLSKERSCSMNWKKVHLKQLKWCFTQFYWSPENALYACFIAKRWRWVWLEMLQLTTQLWKNASFLCSLNPAWSIIISPKFLRLSESAMSNLLIDFYNQKH